MGACDSKVNRFTKARDWNIITSQSAVLQLIFDQNLTKSKSKDSNVFIFSKTDSLPLNLEKVASPTKENISSEEDIFEVKLKVVKDDHQFSVKLSSKGGFNERLWAYHLNKAQISVGEEFIVDQTVYKLVMGPTTTSTHRQTLRQLRKGGIENQKKQVCRICYQQQGPSEDVLISPCRCQGSIEKIHLSCFKKWVFVGKNRAKDVLEVIYDRPNCQICNASFPGSQLFRNIIDEIIAKKYGLYKYHVQFEKRMFNSKKSMLIIAFNNKVDHTIGNTGTIKAWNENMLIDEAAQLEIGTKKVTVKSLLPQNSLFGVGFSSKFPVSIKLNQFEPLLYRFGEHTIDAQIGEFSS